MAAKQQEQEAPPAHDSGYSLDAFFAEQDAVPGTQRNPLKKIESGDVRLSPVQACNLMNQTVGYLMFKPRDLAFSGGKRGVPRWYEVEPGKLQLSENECKAFAKAVVQRNENRKAQKRMEKELEAEGKGLVTEFPAREG